MSKQEHGKKLREKFNLRAKPGQVIPYSQADKGLRKRMQKVMEPVRQAPESFEALMGYGTRPIAKLGRSVNRMLSLQLKFNDVATRVGKAFDDLRTGSGDPEIKATSSALEAEIGAIAIGAKPTMTQEQTVKMINDLHERMAKLAETTAPVLAEADMELRRLLDEARRIDRQRRDAAREIGIHMGAGEKLADKFENGFLKKAVRKANKHWTPKNKTHLKDIVSRADDFNDRASVLQFAREGSFIARTQMKQMRDFMKSQRQKIASFKNEYENVWKPMIEAASKPFTPKPPAP